MLCPHCNQNLLYKERTGKKCSKCRRQFAFEPKTDSLGLHDVRFRRAIEKLGAGGKLYFTAGQLQHFLSRKKIKSSFNSARHFLFFIMFALLAATIFQIISGSSAMLSLVTFLGFIIFAVLLIVFRKTQGTLSLPQSSREFESNVLAGWEAVYQELPANLLANRKLLENSQNLENVRGTLVCPEPEILACLSANRSAENLNLLFLNSSHPEKTKLEFVQKQPDLPVFVLHDASIEGCLLKEEFVRVYLGNDRGRKVFDLGLRPNTAIKAKLMTLRRKTPDLTLKNLSNLTAEEIAWLSKGNYAPLLSLSPTRLIKLVTRAVNRRFQETVKTNRKTAQNNDQRAAYAVGFMTRLGR